MPKLLSSLTLAGVVGAALALAPAAGAQSLSDRINQVRQNQQSPRSRTPDPRAVTLSRLSQPISLDVTDQPLRDVIEFVRQIQGVDILAHYADDTGVGLDPEQPITLTFTNRPALSLIQHVLDLAEMDYDENAWQFTEYGALEIGPKSILNKRKRSVVYPVQDLLIDIPRHDDAPDLNLQTALQQGGQRGGGGGGANIFGGAGGAGEDADQLTEEELLDELTDLILQSIEPEQWLDNGGDGGTIVPWRGNLIVNAPDYMHRQIDGYPWWPSSAYQVARAAPRYVSLGVSLEQATVLDIAQREVTAVTGGGQVVTSGP
jgi:hypothetical protein